jgi:hypothetical protein
MMTAAPNELLGAGSGPLPAHLADCPECANAAKMLRRALGPLAGKLHQRARVRAAMLVGVPAAAAAVVLGVFVARPGSERTVVTRGAAMPANVVSVDVKAGQRATVLKTSDPTVTVVWISPGGSE